MRKYDTKVEFDELDYDYNINAFVVDGKRFNGIAVEWLSDGGLEEVMIIGGLKNGRSREWYPSGLLKLEENYMANILHGISWEWNHKGILIRESIYEFGIKTKEILSDQKGSLQQKYEIEPSNPQLETLNLLRKNGRQKFGGHKK